MLYDFTDAIQLCISKIKRLEARKNFHNRLDHLYHEATLNTLNEMIRSMQQLNGHLKNKNQPE